MLEFLPIGYSPPILLPSFVMLVSLSPSRMAVRGSLSSYYTNLLLFLFFATIIGIGILVAGYSFVLQSPNTEKRSAFECGFCSYECPTRTVTTNFYVIAILFILFDLEIALLVPWCRTASHLGMTGLLPAFI